MIGKELSIFNAHTGLSIATNRYYFVSLDELKRFCSNQFNIPLAQIILISPFGIKLKSSSFEEIDEIYAFDKNLFSQSGQDNVPLRRYFDVDILDNLESLIQPINSPLLDIDLDVITKSRNSRQLISLLTTNLGWAAAIESDSSLFSKKILSLQERIQNLFRALRVAIQYIDGYCSEVERNYETSVSFAAELRSHSLSQTWSNHYENLKQLRSPDGTTLAEYLSERDLEDHAKESSSLNREIDSAFIELKPKIERSRNWRLQVESELSNSEKESKSFLSSLDVPETLSELHLLSDKVQKDTRNLLGKTKNSLDDLDIDVILETFQTHKNSFVTKIYDSSLQLYQHLSTEKELFTSLQVSCFKFLKRLSSSQAEMTGLRGSLKTITTKIEKIQSLESTLAYTIDLPLLYGLYLLENLRREQWLQKIKNTSSKANESFAELREKEIKARNQWFKNYGVVMKLLNFDLSSFSSNNLISFDIVANEDRSVATERKFTYEDCQNYISQLKSNQVSSEVVNLLIKGLDELPLKVPGLDLNLTSPKSADDTAKGYKARIRKLENLLHQEQFKNFNQWPASSSRVASILRYSQFRDGSPLSGESVVERAERSTSPQFSEDLNKLTDENRELTSDLSKHKDALRLLKDEITAARQMLSTKEQEKLRILKELEQLKDKHETDVTKLQLTLSQKQVDKTNLDLSLKEQQERITSLEAKISDKDDLIRQLGVENSERELKHKEEIEMWKKLHDVEELEERYNQTVKKVAALEIISQENEILLKEKDSEILEKDNKIKKLEVRIQDLESSKLEDAKVLELKINDLTSQNATLEQKLEDCKEDFGQLKAMKNDLLENMSNRENEFATEKGAHQEEVESLKGRVEELEKVQVEHEELQAQSVEVTNKHIQTIIQLVIIINSLLIKCRDLSDVLLNIYELICGSLKSIGLLAVKSSETNDVDVIRVKGLRKADNDVTPCFDLANGFKPIVPADAQKYMIWSETPNPQLISALSASDPLKKIEALESICDVLIENYNLTTFEEKYLRFVENVTNLNKLFVPSVSKRFREVEHLAKKELKDNRKLKENERRKISIRDFQVGDLVLFLPTRSVTENQTNNIQWAAFNDMGDVKYLMKNSININPQKQWFIGRILDIEEIGGTEFLVTTQEAPSTRR